MLLGQIVNTDASFIAKRLSEMGINAYYQTVVGDNTERLVGAIKIAEERSDLIILTGGLGPTEDDITKQTVAEHLHEELAIDETALAAINEYFEATGRIMPENNRKQALYFENGVLFANHNGHAVGTFIQKESCAFLLVPGPPRELKVMFDKEVTPFLRSHLKFDRQVILSKTLRFFGIGESELVSRLAPLIAKQTNPTIAPYAGNHEVTLRITASGADEQSCLSLLEQAASEILSTSVGEYYYGEGEGNNLAKVVGDLLADRNLTISAAESLTAGLFQSTLVSVPNASRYFRGGIVAYHEAVKMDILGVPESIIVEHGVVSEECAAAMAEQCLHKFKTDIAISFTGVAGPDALEEQPAGTVWIGINFADGKTLTRKFRFMNGRAGNRERSVLQGLDMLRRALKR